MTTVFHAWPFMAMVDLQIHRATSGGRNFIKQIKERIELHRTNQGSNFLRVSFSSGDNVRAPIQFRRESQPQHLKRLFILKKRPVHFHINSTSVFRPVNQNKLSFSSIEINKPLPAPIQCLVIQVQKTILVVATGQMPDHIQSREQYHQHRQQYYK